MDFSGVSPVRPTPKRVAMLSVHSSPLDQPGVGDAGGMNVYVVELSRRLAAMGTEVEIFTRATSSDLAPVVQISDGVTVRHVTAGPFQGMNKEDLPSQLCALTSGVLRAEAAVERGHYDVIHSHYWLSGQVGWLAKERWGVPLVHSMHTMAKVKNLALAEGDVPEPNAREIGEVQVVEASDRLVANTNDEAQQLIDLYGATQEQVAVVAPGVDLDRFRPGNRDQARAKLGLPLHGDVVLFVGRIQPLKAPDVLLRAIARLVQRNPQRRQNLTVAVVGGPSGADSHFPNHLQGLADSLRISDNVRFAPPVHQDDLANWYRAADVVVVPSYNESFGLVAIEAQACGTPVVAAAVGGLRTAVSHEVSGLLVPGHDPLDYAEAIGRLLDNDLERQALSRGALRQAQQFGWSATAAAMLQVYSSAAHSLALVSVNHA
ncbi:MAG: D-inositol-3-phosphate glycosyltransferase [Actinomycetes bacterium]